MVVFNNTISKSQLHWSIRRGMFAIVLLVLLGGRFYKGNMVSAQVDIYYTGYSNELNTSAYYADPNEMLIAQQFSSQQQQPQQWMIGSPAVTSNPYPSSTNGASNTLSVVTPATSPTVIASNSSSMKIPCGVCKTGEVMALAGTTIPVGTVGFIFVSLKCIEIERIGQRAEFSRQQCLSIRNSILPVQCGCGVPPARAPYTYRPTSPPVPTVAPVTAAPTNIPTTARPTFPLPTTSLPSATPSHTRSESESGKALVTAIVHIQLQSVTELMSRQTIQAYQTEISDFIQANLQRSSELDAQLLQVNATVSNQTLTETVNSRRERFLRQQRKLQTSTGLNPAADTKLYNLDTIVLLTGHVTSNSIYKESRYLFMTEILNLLNGQSNLLILNLQATEGFLAPLYFSTVKSLVASDPALLIDTTSDDSQGTLDAGALGGLIIGLIGIILLVVACFMLAYLKHQKKNVRVMESTGSVKECKSPSDSKGDSSTSKNHQMLPADTQRLIMTRRNVDDVSKRTDAVATGKVTTHSGSIEYKTSNSDSEIDLKKTGTIMENEMKSSSNNGRGDSNTSRRFGNFLRMNRVMTPSTAPDHASAALRSMDDNNHNEDSENNRLLRQEENHSSGIGASAPPPVVDNFSYAQQEPFLGDAGENNDGMSYTYSLDAGTDDGTSNTPNSVGGAVTRVAATASASASKNGSGVPTVPSVLRHGGGGNDSDSDATKSTNAGKPPVGPASSVSMTSIVAASGLAVVSMIRKRSFDRGNTTSNSSSASSDEEGAHTSKRDIDNQLYQNHQNMIKRVVHAPAGKLGIVIDTTIEGPVVFKVFSTSPLEGKVFVGDIITKIDKVDTRAMSASDISNLMISTARKPRKLTVLSEDTTGIQKG